MRNGILIDLKVQAVDVVDGKVLPESLRSRSLHISTSPFPQEWLSRVILVLENEGVGDT